MFGRRIGHRRGLDAARPKRASKPVTMSKSASIRSADRDADQPSISRHLLITPAAFAT